MKSIHITLDRVFLRRCQDIVLSALTLLRYFWYNCFKDLFCFLHFL